MQGRPQQTCRTLRRPSRLLAGYAHMYGSLALKNGLRTRLPLCDRLLCALRAESARRLPPNLHWTRLDPASLEHER